MKYYKVNDIANMLEVSKSKAYKIIQTLNKELKVNGYIVIAGRVPKKYFDNRFNL